MMHKTWMLGLAAVVVAGLAGACTPERLLPQQTAMGVARLTMRNAGNLVALIQADAVCGFSSPAVNAAGSANGDTGSPGSMTWAVTDCALDLGDVHEIAKDCNGETTSAGGRVRVSGTKTLRGVLTGNAQNPVVPAGPDAVEFTLSAVMDGYVVEAQKSNAWLTVKRGTMTFVASPHLGQSVSLGVCAVATGDLTLSNVVYQDALGSVKNGNRTFEVNIPHSDLSAQVGKWADRENDLTGEITVWGTKVNVPIAKDKDGLDPDYDAAKHLAAMACTPDLVQPLTYECKSVLPQLAEGVARLSVATFGNVMALVDANTSCGFASADVLAAAQPTGEAGRPGGQVTWTLAAPCTVEIPQGTVVSQDCNGITTSAGGTLTVTGSKTVTGILTGDPAQPVVPTGRDPAEITLSATLTNFTVTTSNSTNSMTVRSGTLSGVGRPRLGKDAATGACSVATPVVEFHNLSWANGAVQLHAQGNAFNLAVGQSSLDAQNGTKDGKSNVLDGTINVEGETFTVPLDRNALILDPAFDDAAFTASFACKPGLVVPTSDAECSITASLVDGAARLVVQNFGAVLAMVDKDTHCGFSSPEVNSHVALTGTVGDAGGTAVWTVGTPCTLSVAVPTPASSDCLGVVTTVSGQAVVTGTKTLHGILTGDPTQPVIPLSRDPAEISLTVNFTGFKVSTSNSTNMLTIQSGQVSGTAKPRVALDQTNGACSLSTPVVEFSNLNVSNAALAVTSGPKTFVLNVPQAALNAQNGNKGAKVNYLLGTMTAEGTAYPVPADQTHPLLNPDYNQATFDHAYACVPNLLVPASDADCNFYKLLAENAGRLLVQTAGTIGTMVNEDTACGFEKLAVKTRPVEVNGNPGEQGSLRWQLSGCSLGWNDTHTFQRDCSGGELKVTGKVDVDAGRTVTGVRENLLLVIKSIRPTARNDVELRLDKVTFHDFSVAYQEPGTSAAKGYLVIHGGNMTSHINPILGERASDHGKFDVPVPVAVSTSDTTVTVENLEGTLYAAGKQFNLHIPAASVDGYNGSWQGRTNDLRGTITLGSEQFTLGGVPLNPAYSQQSFQAAYMCTADLAGPIPQM